MSSTPAFVHQAARALAVRHQPSTRNEYGACTVPGYVVGPGSEDRARVHHQLPPADLTDPDRPSSHERWEEQGARVAEYATTLEAAGWTVVRKEVLTGPVLLAVPPEEELTPEETGERENSLLYWLGPRTDAAAETWPCPLCEDAYAFRPVLRDHLAEDHGEDPDDFTLAPRAEAGQ